jgi:hypothetical protein
MTLAVGFNPRIPEHEMPGVAQRRLTFATPVSIVAPRRRSMTTAIRGLKPTAKFIASLRDVKSTNVQ